MKRVFGLPAMTLAVALAAAAGAGTTAGAAAPASVDAPVAAPGHRVEVLATGSRISGANGMQVGPDGRLYVASVVGSELLVLDTADGRVLRRFTHADGVEGPDDVAFAPDGSVYWTSILSGEVTGFRPDGTRVVAARIGPGVNPLTFSPSGRLFVAQCFFGTGLFEVDPDGVEPPRVIRDDLGPRCGLNGMDWGPDGRLYGPRWFRGEVVSIDVDSGEMRTELTGVQVPAAVKFDSKGRLHVLDTLAGQVLRVQRGADGAAATTVLVASFPPGLDNFAFDASDTLYVSSFVDGFVARVNPDGSQVMLSPAGMSSPGGVAARVTADGVEAVVADLQALRGFDARSGKARFTEANVLGVSPMGTALNVSIDGDDLVLASWVDNDVRVWNQRDRRVVERHEGLQEPVAAVRFDGGLAIAEHKAGRVILLKEGQQQVLASGLVAPTGLVVRGGDLYLTERSQGTLLRLVADGAVLARPEVVLDGLAAPEGVALHRDGFAIVEAGTGAVTVVDGEGRRTTVARLPVGLPAGSAAQPPSFVFNGIASTGDGALIVTDERARTLLRIVPMAP